MHTGIGGGREALTIALQRQLAMLASYVSLAGQNNLTSSHVAAETTAEGLLNRVYGWELVNANNIRQNYPGVDLIDTENSIAVQVTANNSLKKVRDTLEKAGKGGVVYKKLIVLLLTNEKPTDSMRNCTVAAYRGAMEVWNLADVLRDAKELDPVRLAELTEYMEAELGGLREQVRELRHLELPPATGLPPTGFVGRGAELAEIRSRFAKGDKQVVLTGLGGIGKTELAARYGREHPGVVHFVRFDTNFTHTIENMVHGIRPELSEAELLMDKAILRKRVLDLLAGSGPEGLLIIDNADSPTGVLADLLKDEDYRTLDKLPLRLLITTRSDAPRAVEVRAMEPEPLFEIFRSHGAELEEREMEELIRAVNGHTLTVDLIARTLNGKGWRRVTADHMLTALRSHTLRDQKYRRISTDYNQSTEQAQIYEHLSVVFDVSGMPDVERAVMGCGSLLPEGGMDGELFGYSLREAEQDALDRLLEGGWLEMKDGLLTIHPVIRLVCLTELTPAEEDSEGFLERLWEQYDPKEHRPAHHSQMAELFALAHDRLGSRHGRWLNYSGIIRNGLREDQKQYDLYAPRLPALEAALPPDSPELAEAYNYYGLALDGLGRYQDALTWGKKALAIREAVLPKNDPKLAHSYNNVGSAYGALGDHRKALEYKTKALTILKEVLPSDHLDLPISYGHVGRTYGNLGDHKRALEYQLKALAIREKVLPLDHPDLAASYNNVGFTYGALGDHKRALEYQLKDLEICEKVLPPEHPDLASSYNDVGLAYDSLGDHKRALEYQLKALAIRKKVLPPEHPFLATSHNNVGYTYSHLGDHKRALEYQLKALAIREKVLPPEHPDLAQSFNNLAWTYHDLGDHQAAARYMRKAADTISRSSLPETHPYRVNYPKWADELEQEAEKVQQMEQAIRAAMKGFGPTTPPFPFGKK